MRTAFLVAANLALAFGHGRMTSPPARQLGCQASSQCGTDNGMVGGGPSSVHEGGRYLHGMCGNAPGEPQKWSNPKEIVATYTEGQSVAFEAVITAHHIGYIEFEICNSPTITEACFKQHRLLRTGCTGDDLECRKWWKPLVEWESAQWSASTYPATAPVLAGEYLTPWLMKMSFDLPEGLTCTHCVVRWHYMTTNSCTAAVGGQPEEFWNCADITINAKNGGTTEDTSQTGVDLSGIQPVDLRPTEDETDFWKCGSNPPASSVGPSPDSYTCDLNGVAGAGCVPCNSAYDCPDSGPPAPTCNDGKMNQDETGVDCGGAICSACDAPAWRTSSWGDCSEPCGAGLQTRTVECVSAGAVVDVEACADLHPAADERSCDLGVCATYSWKETQWGDCNVDCGDGMMSRSVTCVSSVGSVPVADSKCTAGDKPATEKACSMPACTDEGQWKLTAWGMCEAICDAAQIADAATITGKETREVTCESTAGVKLTEDKCSSDSNFVLSRDCTKACSTSPSTWETCAWTECTAFCGGSGNVMSGTKERQVFCILNGEIVDSAACNAALKPATIMEGCNPEACSDNNWMASPWSPCVNNEKRRTMHCHRADGSNAENSECPEGKEPILSKSCLPSLCDVVLPNDGFKGGVTDGDSDGMADGAADGSTDGMAGTTASPAEGVDGSSDGGSGSDSGTGEEISGATTVTRGASMLFTVAVGLAMYL